MSDTPTYRKPLGTRREFSARVRLAGDDYEVCKPSSGDKADVLRLAREKGDITEKHEATSEAGGLRFLARVACACLYHPGGVQRVFDVSEDAEAVKNEPWLDEHTALFLKAFGGKTVEEAKGNSEATPELMAIFGVAKLMHLSPSEVREWPWDDVVHVLAHCSLEREDYERHRAENAPTGAVGGTSGSTTTTTVYRFAPTPPAKPAR